jgi:hypothetical protein
MRVKNKSFSQLMLSLPSGRSIPIPARGSVEISDEDFASPECQRLFAERTLIVLPEAARQRPGTPTQPSA